MLARNADTGNGPPLIRTLPSIAQEAVKAFFEDEAISHAAAMAFYAVTALAPVILIVLAIAGAAFGQDAARIALSAQLTGLMGPQSADLLEATIRSAAYQGSSFWAAIIGVGTLLVTASGVFGEMQASLNKVWDVETPPVSLPTLLRARMASLGLVAALGFLLLVSLVASTAINAVGAIINANLPFGEAVLRAVSFVVDLFLISLLFAAIYKVLPDRRLKWRDVIVGAVLTAILFTTGKALIGWYLGASTTATSYGAAGGLFVLLLWVFYSSVIFLFGAELTHAYSRRYHLSAARPPKPVIVPIAQPRSALAEVPNRAISIGLVGVAMASAALTWILRTRQ